MSILPYPSDSALSLFFDDFSQYRGVAGIYWIYCLANGKGYIGQARNIKERWNQHRRQLVRVTKSNPHLQNAYDKYGPEVFLCGVFETFDVWTDALLNEREVALIAEYETFGPNGFNLTIGGDGASGYIPSSETRAKMSAARMGKKHTDEGRAKMSGKRHTAESIAKQAAALAKTWLFVNPAGALINIVNLNAFCLEHGLHQGGMSHVYNGKRNHHKGWTKPTDEQLSAWNKGDLKQ